MTTRRTGRAGDVTRKLGCRMRDGADMPSKPERVPLMCLAKFDILQRWGVIVVLAAGLAASAAENHDLLRTEPSGAPWDATAPVNNSKVIYGADDRIDVYEETDADRLAWAAATCAVVYASDLTATAEDMYALSVYAYMVSGKPPCDGEPFADQPTAAFCTAFMVGDNLVATAGHCVSAYDLPDVRFLFGFEMTDPATPILYFHKDQIYTGEEILSRVGIGDDDHAVVRLDRTIVAPGARALPLRRTGSVDVGENVGVIGHPYGLPKKIAFGEATAVRSNPSASYFVANLDTYGGNSGSPVFNAHTGLVEGILVRGATDFVIESDCFRSNVYTDGGGLGEDVT
ncbi:MAG TPA: serine protease, partial [Candidatus Hydrogenedentes bacterium]|nr:serine protease [Candidatus Hydrogenedentota bacterium]